MRRHKAQTHRTFILCLFTIERTNLRWTTTTQWLIERNKSIQIWTTQLCNHKEKTSNTFLNQPKTPWTFAIARRSPTLEVYRSHVEHSRRCLASTGSFTLQAKATEDAEAPKSTPDSFDAQNIQNHKSTILYKKIYDNKGIRYLHIFVFCCFLMPSPRPLLISSRAEGAPGKRSVSSGSSLSAVKGACNGGFPWPKPNTVSMYRYVKVSKRERERYIYIYQAISIHTYIITKTSWIILQLPNSWFVLSPGPKDPRLPSKLGSPWLLGRKPARCFELLGGSWGLLMHPGVVCWFHKVFWVYLFSSFCYTWRSFSRICFV